MYNYQYGYQYPYYGTQQPLADNLSQLRMNNTQMQNPVTSQPVPSQTQPANSLIWVQGEAGAKSYLVAPNATVMLLDSENSSFYLKSADASGMPLPLRIFDYQERTNAKTQIASPVEAEKVDFGEFITRKEFEERIASINTKNQPKKSNSLTEDA